MTIRKAIEAAYKAGDAILESGQYFQFFVFTKCGKMVTLLPVDTAKDCLDRGYMTDEIGNVFIPIESISYIYVEAFSEESE